MRCLHAAMLGFLAVAPAAGQELRQTGALAYTVVRTPPAERLALPALDLRRNTLVGRVKPFPERSIPDIFWYDAAGMSYGLVYQDRPAPLVVLIAGTGGSFDTETNRLLARVLYDQGFHVLGLPSPTHPNFIINASETAVPGRMPDDARDLYRAMQLALAEIGDTIEITATHLTGYSLGAANAAWVARLDEREREIGFDEVLLLNPPVSLYNSVQILDAMYDRHIGDDPESSRRLTERVFTAFASFYTGQQDTNLDGDFLYTAYEELKPGVDALETLIGASFRLSSMNLAFTSDVMSRGGYFIASDAELTATTSLTNVFKHAVRHSFIDFFDGLYMPFFQAREPGFTREAAIAETGLRPLEGWLRANPRVSLVTNRDDIILAPGEIDWLGDVFGERAVIFGDGGHCGNYDRGDVAEAIARILRG